MYLRFHYLYRNAGNFNKYGYVDFIISEIPDLFFEINYIKSFLIEELYFDPKNFQIPELSFESFDRDIDHDWHEFSHLEWIREGKGNLKWDDWKRNIEKENFSLLSQGIS